MKGYRIFGGIILAASIVVPLVLGEKFSPHDPQYFITVLFCGVGIWTGLLMLISDRPAAILVAGIVFLIFSGGAFYLFGISDVCNRENKKEEANLFLNLGTLLGLSGITISSAIIIFGWLFAREKPKEKRLKKIK